MHHVPLTSNYHVGGIQHTIYPQKGGLSHTSHMYSICWWIKTHYTIFGRMNSKKSRLLTHADLTPWALKWGIPKSPWVSILKWSSMTWMISGYPHGLGNLHIKTILVYIYIPLHTHYDWYIPIIYPLYGGFLKWRGTPKSSTLIGFTIQLLGYPHVWNAPNMYT